MAGNCILIEAHHCAQRLINNKTGYCMDFELSNGTDTRYKKISNLREKKTARRKSECMKTLIYVTAHVLGAVLEKRKEVAMKRKMHFNKAVLGLCF